MWIKTENSDNNKPASLDTTSSRYYVYLRRNYKLVEKTEQSNEHWEYEELKIPVDQFETYNNIEEVSDATIDLASYISELEERIRVLEEK